MIIDLARIVEIHGKRIDIEELIRMAKQLDQTYELLFADHLLSDKRKIYTRSNSE